MTLIDLSHRDSANVESSINLRVEFNDARKSTSSASTVPTRISGVADDLAECDAVSTCPSDSDSVVLFESSSPQSSFVCGSSVIFRNLRPEILPEDVLRWVQSTGMNGEVNCPSFEVVGADGKPKPFNFGFCTVKLSAHEEAVLLNFLLHSTGLDEVLCLSPQEERPVRSFIASPAVVASV